MEIQTIFPKFIGAKQAPFSDSVVRELIRLGIEFAERNRKGENNEIEPVLDKTQINPAENSLRYVSHERANIFADYPESWAIKEWKRFCYAMAEEYMLEVHKYRNDMELNILGDAVYQYSPDYNAGVPLHNHTDCDFAISYYPLVDFGDKYPSNAYNRGALRFFNPDECKRHYFPHNNEDFISGYNCTIEASQGSAFIFEGNALHDSTHFEGLRRLCLPAFVSVKSPEKKVFIP